MIQHPIQGTEKCSKELYKKEGFLQKEGAVSGEVISKELFQSRLSSFQGKGDRRGLLCRLPDKY